MSGSVARIDKIDANAIIANLAAQSQGITSLVDANTVAVPNTTITGRAQIVDLANDLGVRFGVNRIMVQQILPLQNEFGPLGEPVFSSLNDFLGQIRFVGPSWVNTLSGNGTRPQVNTTSDNTNYAEITFYGTGLSMLIIPDSTTTDIRAAIDGGAEGSNLVPAFSAVLEARGYTTNTIIKVASGLTLGVHTIKIRKADTTSVFSVYGFEILNENTTIKVNPGTIYGNKSVATLATQQSVAYNASFESGSLGTRGGHVLVYAKNDGTIAKAVTPTGSQLNMASADHTNEEVIRTYYYREFGAARADDFSLYNTSGHSAQFVLDDDTASLTVNSANLDPAVSVDGLPIANGANNFMTFTFVGTGLDVIMEDLDLASTRSISAISVDGGSSIGSITDFGATGNLRRKRIKIVSGLPYGTHTVRFTNTAVSANSQAFLQFVVYGPKTPTLPTNAVAIADYNVVADFSAGTTATVDALATGVLRKSTLREVTLVGTWVIGGINIGNAINGNNIQSSTSGAYMQYTFYGTGLELRGQAQNNASTVGVTFNGLAATTANFSTLVSSAYGGYLFSAGSITQNANTNGSGVSIRGLPLALYTVRFTLNSSNTIVWDTLDLITPIHSAKSLVPGDFQNTLAIGSQAINDRRSFGSQTVRTKAYAQAIGVVSSPSTSSTVPVVVADMSVTIPTEQCVLDLSFFGYGSNSTAATRIQFYVDGVPVGKDIAWSSNINTSVSLGALVPVAKGVHKVDLYMWSNGGSVGFNSDQRIMKVLET